MKKINQKSVKKESMKRNNRKSGKDIGIFWNCNHHHIRSCAFCGCWVYGEELQYAIGEDAWVCEKCVEKNAPAMIDTKKAAYIMYETAVYYTKQEIKHRINDALNETVEQRIRRAVEDACRTEDDL